MKYLMIFIPLAFVLDLMDQVPAAMTFAAAALGIVPLASVMANATERISFRTGQTIGALLNATFGNAP